MTSPLPAALAPYIASLPVLPLRVDRADAGVAPDLQTARTIARMTAAAERAAKTDMVRRATMDAARQVPRGAKPSAIAAAIFWWVKGHVTFRDDPQQDELLLEPDLLLAMSNPQGDCDDFSMITAAMLTVAGIPWEFVTVAADPTARGRFSHVYVRAMVEE